MTMFVLSNKVQHSLRIHAFGRGSLRQHAWLGPSEMRNLMGWRRLRDTLGLAPGIHLSPVCVREALGSVRHALVRGHEVLDVDERVLAAVRLEVPAREPTFGQVDLNFAENLTR